jgi:ATP-binding cassette subfamily F protein 3
MIHVRDVDLTFGAQHLFDHISFTIKRGQRIGLIGRNGSGKSTLLKVLAGQQRVDQGEISIEKDTKLAYMPQEVVFTSQLSVFDETFSVFTDIFAMYQEIKRLERQLKECDNSVAHAEMVDRYSQMQHKLNNAGASARMAETKKVLMGLGLTPERFDVSIEQLSVGWRMRVVLAKLLLQKADFYLFDEPTNHLDIVAKEWFCDFLAQTNAGFLLVSHDKYFLDTICESIIEIENGNAHVFQGNYTKYVIKKEKDLELLEKRHQEQQRQIKRKQETIDRFRAKATKAKMVQKMIKDLSKIERINLASTDRTITMNIAPVARAGRVVLTANDLQAAYDSKVIFKGVSCIVERGEKVAIIAPNGTGKTTLFNLLVGKLAAQKGHITLGHNVTPAYFEQDQEKALDYENTILQEVALVCTTPEARKQARSLLGAFLFPGDDVDKKISVLSGGEKNRVAMVKILLQDANLLLLDEPTNHLDLESKDVLRQALEQYNGTIVFVSHDRDILEHLATRIIELTPHRAMSYPGNYSSYLYHKKVSTSAVDVSVADKIMQKKQKSRRQAAYLRNKKIRNLESKIERLENKLAYQQEQLNYVSYGADEYNEVVQRIDQLECELDEQLERWEELQKS